MGEAAGDGEAPASEGMSGQTSDGPLAGPATEMPAVTLMRLRAEAQRMKEAKKALTKNLRNAKRQNQRLKSKAKKLSDNELLQIVAMRQALPLAGPGQSANASSSSGGSSSGPSSPAVARAASIGTGEVGGNVVSNEDGASDAEAGSRVNLQRLASRMEL